jgi:hypothetical protein
MTMPPDKTNDTRQNMNIETTARCSRQFPWLMTVLLGLFIMQISGCANVPVGSDTMKQQALSFSPPPGKAGLYVIRSTEYSGSVLLEVISLDYEGCGSLAGNTYLFGTVLPGEHAIQSGTPDSSSGVVHFTAEAGKNYYFMVGIKGALFGLASAPATGKPVIQEIAETDGQKYVRQAKISGDNRFQFQNEAEQTK